MFSSLASFLFGSNTNCETNSKATDTATAIATGVSEQRDPSINLYIDTDNLIQVTSLTPSVTGAGDIGITAINRGGKNKRNNRRQKKKREDIKVNLLLSAKQTKLLSSGDSCDEEEFDEGEWFIVEKEKEEIKEEKNISPVRPVSEGKNAVTIDIPTESVKFEKIVAAGNLVQQHRPQHINSHSLYSGPRPQKQRNILQKTRTNTSNQPNKGLSVSTLSPSRTANDGHINNGHKAIANDGVTRSLYTASTVFPPKSEGKSLIVANGVEAMNKMDESWLVTPPPCFTSIGPINMETSPYENLLIEHPSMSVYHSIKTAQEAAESFIKLDIDVNTMARKQKQRTNETIRQRKNSQAVQPRATGTLYRLDRLTVAQLKQQLMATNVHKMQSKRELNDYSRSAIKRANKVYDVQSRNHTKRRSDRQHSKIFSNANNNRKTNTY